jgi:bifunctional polynucleotide phosphatase/kinase
VPISVLAATREDAFRKPSTGMWPELRSLFREERVLTPNGELDAAGSFYVGDAAGRGISTLAGRKKDFGCGDRKFSRNVGMKFLTPEEFFRSAAPVPFDWDGVSPEDLEALTAASSFGSAGPKADGSQDLVVLVGFAGSGKSSFYHGALAPAGYAHVNRDSLKTPAKCLKAAEDALRAGKSVCVDNTNASEADRKPYVDLAKKYGVEPRAVFMATSEAMSRHLSRFREERMGGTHIPGVAYAVFKKRFQAPSLLEGFGSIETHAPRIDPASLSDDVLRGLMELS